LLTSGSSIDQHTESRMQQVIREEFIDHTIIAIAHRLETIAEFDRVVLLEKGCIVDQGNPAELLERKGPFKALWDAAHQTAT
jgi:ATP-binding cassette subfamily C (CFTR/MRP) protein 1